MAQGCLWRLVTVACTLALPCNHEGERGVAERMRGGGGCGQGRSRCSHYFTADCFLMLGLLWVNVESVVMNLTF